MILDFSQKNLKMIFEVDEEKRTMLKHFGRNVIEDSREKKPMWSNIAEIHVTGENQNDHHGAKHTGSSRSFTLRYVSHTATENEFGTKVEFLLADDTLQAVVHYQLYREIAAVRAWTVVTNIGSEPLGLEYVSSFSYTGIDEGARSANEKMTVYVPHNSVNREANWSHHSLGDLGIYSLGGSIKRFCCSNTGAWSAKEYLPMGAFENAESENAVMWQIEHNGSWQWEIADAANMLYLKLSGPEEQENHWYKELGVGESFESVKVALAVGSDFEGALAELTKYRRTIIRNNPENAALPIIFNDYMNCLGGNPTEEKEFPMIDKAAEVGAEYYCMDAGWYADGGWWETVGEWLPCEWRFPNGIKRVFDYVREKGMIPGIWVEIEVMGIHCPLAEVFEDECFFMRHGKRVIDHGRYQLDFRHPSVRKHATDVIDRLISEYGVGYLKMDYNIEPGMGTEVDADSFGDGLLGHNRAYLAWLDELKEKYPSLIIECCSSGGMRMDYAMLQRGHLQSVTDMTSARHNAVISASSATAVLPEQGAIWSYPLANADETSVVLNMVNVLLQRIHLSGKITQQSDESLALIKEGLDCYKQIRSDIPTAIPFYPMGLPKHGDEWFAVAHRYQDCIRMSVWRMDGENDSVTIPMSASISSCKVLYPSKLRGNARVAGNAVTVTLDTPRSAILLEIR